MAAMMSQMAEQAKPISARRLLHRRYARVLAGKASPAGIREVTKTVYGNRPRCGAHARSTGQPCQAPCWVRADGTIAPRCKLHGGKSTGPKTQAGKDRSERARIVGYCFWLEERRRAVEASWRAAGRWLSRHRPAPATDEGAGI